MARLGVDVAAVDRFEHWNARFDEATLAAIFTDGERAYCRAAGRPGRRYALCFASKEATAKALGTGLSPISWTEIEVMPGPPARRSRLRQLAIDLRGAARARARQIGCRGLRGACGLGDGYALALVVAFSKPVRA